MKEVAANVFSFFEEVAPRFGVTLEELVDGLPAPTSDLASLRAKRERFDLDVLIALDDRLVKLSGATPAELGGAFLSAPYAMPYRKMAALFFTPETLYQLAVRWVLPLLYRDVTATVTSTATHLEIAVELPTVARSASNFFHMTAGSLAVLPTLLGQADSVVKVVEDGPTRALFRVDLPSDGKRTFSLRRWITGGLTLLEQLTTQQEQLVEKNSLLARAQVDRAASEHQYQALIEHAQDVIMLLSPEGTFQFVSRGVLAFGWQPDELIGRHAFEMVHPDDLSVAQQRFSRRVNRDAPALPQHQLRLRCKNGEWRSVEVSATNLLDDPAIRGVILNARDVTERTRLRAEIDRADRMSSLGMLAAGVAHELNTPLSFLLGNLELLRDALAGAGRDIVDPLTDAIEGAMRVEAIARDLRTLARAEPSPDGTCDPAATLQSALKLTAQVRERAALETALGPMPSVRGDAGRLGQVLVNLLVNAAHAVPEAGVIRVRTSTSERGWAVIEIEDSGPGVPDDIRSRIFEPFVTSKKPGEGTGLGLSISHAIITAMGGTIAFGSAPTVFRLELPPTATPLSTRRRLLVVDDEPSIGRSIVRMLRNHDVVPVQSGAMALAQLSTQTFDAILCDISMPGMNGMQLYERIREQHPAHAAKMIFMTGAPGIPAVQAFGRSIPNRILEKPFDASELKDLVDTI